MLQAESTVIASGEWRAAGTLPGVADLIRDLPVSITAALAFLRHPRAAFVIPALVIPASPFVIPAKAGIQSHTVFRRRQVAWIPAFAGMTMEGGNDDGRHE